MNKSMDERSKRIRNKTHTHRKLYQMRRNINIKRKRKVILIYEKRLILSKKQLLQSMMKKILKNIVSQELTIPTNVEYSHTHNCTNMDENKKAEMLLFQNKCNNFDGDLTNFSNNNQSLVPTIVSDHSDLSLSEISHSTILNLNSHTSETLPVITTKTVPSRKHDTDRERSKDHDQDLENVLTTNEHDNNAIKTRTLQQDFKSMIQMSFKSINDMLRKQQQQLNEINLQLKQNANTYAIPKKPSYFPMESVESLDRFDNCSVEEYKNTISFFHFLGGFNLKECVSSIIKESVTDDFSMTLTWTGYGNTIEIASRRFTAAIYEALARNNNFSKPQIAELKDAVTEGLRNAKQRVRNKEKEKNGKTKKGKREIFAEKIRQNLDVLNI